MTDYPLSLHYRNHVNGFTLNLPAPLGVPEVDAQVDLLAAVQGKYQLAVEKQRAADVNLHRVRNDAAQRLRESIADGDDPDVSGDATVTTAEMTLDAAMRITAATEEVRTQEFRRLHELVGEHGHELRSTLWKRAEKARDALAGAAFAAERAYAQLQASAGMVTGLDEFLHGNTAGTNLGPRSHQGAAEASQVAEQAKEALRAVNAFLDRSWEPAPKPAGGELDVSADDEDDFGEVG